MPNSDSHSPGTPANLLQYQDRPVHLLVREQPLWSPWTKIRKMRFIEQGRVHRSLFGQVIDDQVDELGLTGCQVPVVQEFAKLPLGGFPVKAFKGTN